MTEVMVSIKNRAGIHARPAAPWTVAGLANQVALARSTFAARFADLASLL